MPTRERVIALGFFDGVHLGHKQLLKTAADTAAKTGTVPSLITFDNHPDTLVRGSRVELINSAEDRALIVKEQCGIEDMILLHFDEQVMRTPWRDFMRSLVCEYNAGHIVIGDDFCCGYRGEGTADLIAEFCSERGIGCDIIPKVAKNGVSVSSTYIRELLLMGDISSANEFLGHRHFFTDTVVRGRGVGRQLGTPTINMHFQSGVLVPRRGVYAAVAHFGGKSYGAVTNIGIRPTFGESEDVSVESWLFDYSGSAYGEKVRLEFVDFIRPEQKFDSPEALSTQILADSVRAREILR